MWTKMLWNWRIWWREMKRERRNFLKRSSSWRRSTMIREMNSKGLRTARTTRSFWALSQRSWECGRTKRLNLCRQLRERKTQSQSRKRELGTWRKRKRDLRLKWLSSWRIKDGVNLRSSKSNKKRLINFSRSRLRLQRKTKRKRRSIDKRRSKWWRSSNRWMKHTRSYSMSWERRNRRIESALWRSKSSSEWSERLSSSQWKSNNFKRSKRKKTRRRKPLRSSSLQRRNSRRRKRKSLRMNSQRAS